MNVSEAKNAYRQPEIDQERVTEVANKIHQRAIGAARLGSSEFSYRVTLGASTKDAIIATKDAIIDTLEDAGYTIVREMGGVINVSGWTG
jgi:hypothetical protein